MFATRHRATPVSEFGLVVVVASLGGMHAFTTFLAGLPATFPVPVVVVQHRLRIAGLDVLAAALSRSVPLPVRAAVHGEPVHRPGVTVLPGQTVATIDSAGCWCLSEATPGVLVGDAVLSSAAETTKTIAVILTGYQDDGSRGVRAVKVGGGRVLVQEPASARAASMPAHAIATGCADFVLPLDRISTAVLALTTAPAGAAAVSW